MVTVYQWQIKYRLIVSLLTIVTGAPYGRTAPIVERGLETVVNLPASGQGTTESMQAWERIPAQQEKQTRASKEPSRGSVAAQMLYE